MRRFVRRGLAVLAVVWMALGVRLLAQAPPGLATGDTFVMLGDSITRQCLYTRYVALFYYTRFPETRLRIVNAGVGGDRAIDGLARFDAEVLAMKPALVTVLLGMNDGSYKPLGEPQFGTYKADMTKLIDRIAKETQARLVLLTPTMYDQEVNKARKRVGVPEYNNALIAFGDFLRETGKARNLQVIDLNAPLVAATAELRKTDPAATLIPDAVHPGPAGHLVMAFTILKAFGMGPVVSAVTVDAAAMTISAENATAAELSKEGDVLSFYLRARSLPFPYAEPCQNALALVPFTDTLNRETLKVTGLAPGQYALLIGRSDVGTFDAAELAAGINLSTNEKTPQYDQARQVMDANDKMQERIQRIRTFRVAEKRKGYKLPDGTYKHKFLRGVKGEDGKTKYVENEEEEARFAQAAAQIPELLADIAHIEDIIYQGNKPVNHHYRLVRKVQP